MTLSSPGNDILCCVLRQEVSLLRVGCDEQLSAEIRPCNVFQPKTAIRESSNDLDPYQQTLKNRC